MESIGLDIRSNRKRKADRVPAKGRGQTCTQQGMVVGTVDFSRTQYEDRKMLLPVKAQPKDLPKELHKDPVIAWQQTNKTFAPLGDETCFQAMQGEIAIAAVNDNGITERNPLANDSSLSVTTTTNAWPVDKDAMFAGVVRNARPLSSKDSKGTIAYVGTQTVMNTGPDEILPGDEVLFSMTPYAVVENGAMRNVLEADEAGEPGHQGTLNADGLLAAKFRPTIYPLRDNSIYAMVRRGTLGIDQAGAGFVKELNTFNPVGFDVKAAIKKAITEVQKLYIHQPSDFPVMQHMKVYTCYAMFSVLSSPTVIAVHGAGNAGDLIRIYGEIDTYINEEYFDGDFGTNTKRRKYEEAIDRDATFRKKQKPIFTARAFDADFAKQSLDFTIKLERAKVESLCEIHNFVRRRLIGKCIRGNVSGAGIDIACGYTHK